MVRSRGANQALTGSTEAALYGWVFEYETGACVAHGVNAQFLPNGNDPYIEPDNEIYKAKADSGGGWVTYRWRNNANEDYYMKSAYVLEVGLRVEPREGGGSSRS